MWQCKFTDICSQVCESYVIHIHLNHKQYNSPKNASESIKHKQAMKYMKTIDLQTDLGVQHTNTQTVLKAEHNYTLTCLGIKKMVPINGCTIKLTLTPSFGHFCESLIKLF